MSIELRIARCGGKAERGRVIGPLFLAGVFLLLGACAGNGDKRFVHDTHAQAKSAYMAQDYQRVLALVEPQATAGAAWAQYTLGYMYYYGHGLRIDRRLARQWIEQAAGQDYPPAKEALQRLPSAPSLAVDEAAAQPALTPVPASPSPIPEQNSPQPLVFDAPPVPDLQAPPGLAAGAPEPAIRLMQPAAELETAAEPELASSVAMTQPVEGAQDAWIQAQDPQRLTLQLIGSSDKNAITRFIAEQELGEQAATYTTRRAGEPWYVVIYGSYGDLTEARAALSTLPMALRQASPWIRTFAEIQNQLAAGVP